MFKQGFDLPTALLIDADFSKLYSLQSLLCSLIVGIPFNVICVVLFLKYLAAEKEKTE